MLITTRARKTTATFVGLALATTLALTGCSDDTEATPGVSPSASTSEQDTKTPEASLPPLDAESFNPEEDLDPDVQDAIDSAPTNMPVDADPENRNQFNIDFSQIEIPAEVTEAYGEELSNRLVPDAANLLSIFKNENVDFTVARDMNFEEQKISDVFREHLTDSAFQEFHDSYFNIVEGSAAAYLLTYTGIDGTIPWGDSETPYTVDPEMGIVSTLAENPTVEWYVAEDGAEGPVVQFYLETTYYMEEGTFVVDGWQRLALVPNGEDRWVIDGWSYGETGVTQL